MKNTSTNIKRWFRREYVSRSIHGTCPTYDERPIVLIWDEPIPVLSGERWEVKLWFNIPQARVIGIARRIEHESDWLLWFLFSSMYPKGEEVRLP